MFYYVNIKGYFELYFGMKHGPIKAKRALCRGAMLYLNVDGLVTRIIPSLCSICLLETYISIYT